MSFQTIFFERFIACFKVKGNVGFFIITIDFVGYLGTLALLTYKEFMAPHVDWTSFYNGMSVYVGIACCLAFAGSIVYIIRAKYLKAGERSKVEVKESTQEGETCQFMADGTQPNEQKILTTTAI